MAALMLTAATACTSDNEPLQNNDVPPTGRPVTITATYQGTGTPDGTDAQTRTDYGYDMFNNTVEVTWKAGDKIYVINSENLKKATPSPLPVLKNSRWKEKLEKQQEHSKTRTAISI